MRRFFALLTFGALAFSLLASAGLMQVEAGAQKRPVPSLGTSVVISEFRTRGPSGENDEFIELFNPTHFAVDISGWKIWASDNVGLTSVIYVFPASTLIQPGQHRLIINSSGYTGSVLADSDIFPSSYASDITDTGGIALSLPNDTIVNQVGMGLGSTYKEDIVINPLLGNINQSYSRVYLYGCQDNDNNSIDFVLINPSTPQNSSSIFNVCPLWERLILINEVAWGGTQADDTLAQWIELHNPSLTEPIILNGLYLQSPGKDRIPLSGSIPPGGYYLIERNQSDTNVPANLVYAFPFLNVSGDSLYLYSDTNDLVDSANSDGGLWPAGNRFAFYHSMERRSNEPDTDPAWLTFNGTPFALDRLGNLINGSPGAANIGGAISTPTFTPTATFTPTITLTPTPTFTRTLTSTPSALRSIVINEVAWMGTLASDTDEWIELYNPGTVPIDITGWTLTASTTFSVTLNGTIPAGSYFLLERTDDDTIKDIEADQIFTGSLTNTGMILQLKSSPSSIVDTANGNGGVWPAGNSNADKRCSMERRGASFADSDTAWITNTGVLKNGTDSADGLICGTPRNVNWAYFVTPTPSPAKSTTPTRTPTKTRTPTRIPAAKISQIIINEFLPHSRSDWNNDGSIDSGDEFIELMNVGNVSMSIQGWKLDDQNGDSSPYTIEGVTLEPGARQVFFASQTGLLLSNRSDSVRLFMANGTVSDAFTYTTVPIPDQTWCRLPDGKAKWVFGCQPTLSQINKQAETVYRGEMNQPIICESPNLPVSIYLAECMPSGLESWSRRLWDDLQPVFRVLVERHGQEYWIE